MPIETPEKAATPEQQEIARLREENVLLHIENRRLKEMAYTDALMDIPNRNAFNERRNETPDAILMLDIDNFKIVNDAFQEGHLGGDRILQEAGAYLKTYFRNSDFIARYGGEEIIVFLKNADVEQLTKRPQLGFTATLDGEEIPITFSGGLTSLHPGENVMDAIQRADAALFTAKEDKTNKDGTVDRGRNRILIYSKEREEASRPDGTIEPTAQAQPPRTDR